MTPEHRNQMAEGRVIDLRQRCIRCHWILSPDPGEMINCDECPGPYHPTCFQSHIDHDECPRFGRHLLGQAICCNKISGREDIDQLRPDIGRRTCELWDISHYDILRRCRHCARSICSLCNVEQRGRDCV
jgi:hypothetical protein